MKRTLSMILGLALIMGMLVCFSGCTLFTAGKYYIYKMTMDGETITRDDMEDMGVDYKDFYLDLDSDGTGVLCSNGSEQDMEWDEDEIWPEGDKDEAAEYEVKGSKLILEQDGMEMVFKKK